MRRGGGGGEVKDHTKGVFPRPARWRSHSARRLASRSQARAVLISWLGFFLLFGSFAQK